MMRIVNTAWRNNAGRLGAFALLFLFGLLCGFNWKDKVANSTGAVESRPLLRSLEALPLSPPWLLSLVRSRYYPVKKANIYPDEAYPILAVLQKKLPSHTLQEYRDIALQILKLCQAYNFRPAFILSLIHVESNFQPAIQSGAGAVGLMQILPETAAPIARELGLDWKGKESLKSPKINLQIGFHYLSYLRARFGGISRKYITAYNWGPARVGTMLQSQQRLPLDYYKKIEQRKKEYAFLDQATGF